jgi:hypothetical protein
MPPRWSALLAIGAASTAYADDCPPFDASLSTAQTAIRGFRTVDADASLADALRSVGCTPIDDKGKLGALLRAYGARRFFDEDAAGAERFFAAARTLDDKSFEHEVWGADALRVWFAASGHGGQGRIIAGSGDKASAWMNGRRVTLPAKVEPLPYVVRDGDGHAWVVDVADGADVAVDTGGARPASKAPASKAPAAKTPGPTPPSPPPDDSPQSAPAAKTSATTAPAPAATPSTGRRLRVGVDLGLPLGVRTEWDFDGKVVDSVGLRFGLNGEANNPFVVGFYTVAYVDWHIAAAWAVETNAGVHYSFDYSGAGPDVGAAIQWDPRGVFQANAGLHVAVVPTSYGTDVFVLPDIGVALLF